MFYSHYKNLLEQNNALIYKFTTLKENITDKILKYEKFRTNNYIEELNQINKEISIILDDILIPNEYKLNIINQTDLREFIYNLNIIDNIDLDNEKKYQLFEKLRLFNDKLYDFNNLIINYSQAEYQTNIKIILSSLTLIIVIIIITIFYINYNFLIPFINLLKNINDISTGNLKKISIFKNQEINLIGNSINILLDKYQHSNLLYERYNSILKSVISFINISANEHDMSKILNEFCRILLYNKEYCLVWIGKPDANNKNDLIPVAANACTTMDGRQCEECVAIILTSMEEKGIAYNPGLQAILKKEPVVINGILSNTPLGPFKDTPLFDGNASCLAIPLIYNDEILIVINIYSINGGAFTDEEAQLLKRFADILGLFLTKTHTKTGKNLISEKIWKCSSIGEISGTVMHEINNINNGILNYTQILLDDLNEGRSQKQEQIQFLEQTLKQSEKIAQIIHNIVTSILTVDEVKEYISLKDIFRDIVEILNYQLKIDKIKLKIDMAEHIDSIKISSRHLKSIILSLILNARDTLMSGDANKNINISVDFAKDRNNMLTIQISHRGAEYDLSNLQTDICREMLNKESGELNILFEKKLIYKTILFPL